MIVTHTHCIYFKCMNKIDEFQFKMYTFNTGFCISIDDFSWVLFNREPCQGTLHWRVA